MLKGLLVFSAAWLVFVVALAVLVPDTRLALRDEDGFVEQASWMLHSGALIVATAALWSARSRRTAVDWLLIPLILLGLASELSAFERLFGGFTLGPVFIDAPGTWGIVLGVPEESLEMVAALSLLLGAGARWRGLRNG